MEVDTNAASFQLVSFVWVFVFEKYNFTFRVYMDGKIKCF